MKIQEQINRLNKALLNSAKSNRKEVEKSTKENEQNILQLQADMVEMVIDEYNAMCE